MTGFSDQAASLAIGQPANLVAVDQAGNLLASVVNGQLVSVP
jgi:N-acetylglucosamine-6-phosphate deacetylase